MTIYLIGISILCFIKIFFHLKVLPAVLINLKHVFIGEKYLMQIDSCIFLECTYFKMHDRKRAGHKMAARCAHVWPGQYVIVSFSQDQDQGQVRDADVGHLWPKSKLCFFFFTIIVHVAAVAT